MPYKRFKKSNAILYMRKKTDDYTDGMENF